MEKSEELSGLSEAEKDVVVLEATSDGDLIGEISDEIGDRTNLIALIEGKEVSLLLVKIKSKIPTFEDWIEKRFYDQKNCKEFTEMIESSIIDVAKQFGMKLKNKYRLVKSEYVELGRLIFGEGFRESFSAKIKLKIPTFEDWMKERFFDRKYRKKFMKMFGIGLLKFAKSFGIEPKNDDRLLKAEYVELGRLIYKEGLRESTISKVKSKIPSAEDWVKGRYYLPGPCKDFTKKVGIGLVGVANMLGLETKNKKFLLKAEYIELGKLIYGEEEIELATKEIREKAAEKAKVKAKKRERKAVQKKPKPRKKVEPSKEEIKAAIGDIIEKVSEASNEDLSENELRKRIVSRIKSEVPTFLDWIERRFCDVDNEKEFKEITGSSLYRATILFGVHRGGYGVTDEEYAELGSLIFGPVGVVLFIRGLSILSRSR